jgi:hypothetical protein
LWELLLLLLLLFAFPFLLSAEVDGALLLRLQLQRLPLLASH